MVGNGGVLQVDGADPLTAGLDYILAAVSDLQIAIGVDAGHIACFEPATLIHHLTALALEVARSDPGPTHLEMAGAPAVTRQHLPLLVDHLHFNTVNRTPGLGTHVNLLFQRQLQVLGQEVADGAHRAGLAHPPGLNAGGT
ncbi:hypothetical protein D3C76_1153310 [compost metagenome]